ncbi:hypothetical protein ABW19_dt0207553 [Dactylella cylindrospora]|nr:hypothetical protein ABW19_dt0207553 [Dactylella cylindrospora]
MHVRTMEPQLLDGVAALFGGIFTVEEWALSQRTIRSSLVKKISRYSVFGVYTTIYIGIDPTASSSEEWGECLGLLAGEMAYCVLENQKLQSAGEPIIYGIVSNGKSIQIVQYLHKRESLLALIPHNSMHRDSEGFGKETRLPKFHGRLRDDYQYFSQTRAFCEQLYYVFFKCLSDGIEYHAQTPKGPWDHIHQMNEATTGTENKNPFTLLMKAGTSGSAGVRLAVSHQYAAATDNAMSASDGIKRSISLYRSYTNPDFYQLYTLSNGELDRL